MTVETATYIGQLSPTYPTGSDAKSEGDSHLRLIKSVLQAQFTSLGNAPVTATAAQLNALVSASGLLSVGTSTTSNSIGTGSKTFTTQTGLGFAAGQAVRIQDNASLSNYMLGTVSSYTTATGSLVVSVASTGGSGTIADWSISLSAQPLMTRRAVTGADTLVAADLGQLVDITSGTFTLSVTAVATLGAGWYTFVRNSGSGVVTIDPNSSETIDGSSTATMYENEIRLIQCDGSALRSLVLREPKGYFHLQDAKSSGTAAQSISTTTWTKRELASVTNTITGASVSTSVISLPAGTYRIAAEAAGVNVGGANAGAQRLRLRNTTDGATLLSGVNMNVANTAISPSLALSGVFTITGTKNIELQHYVTTTGGNTGAALTSGESEIYADVLIERV